MSGTRVFRNIRIMINTRGISPGYSRVSINPQTDKTKFCMAWGMFFSKAVPIKGRFPTNKKEKCLLRKGLALLHKPKDYRTYVRRRLRFVCLWGFLDLWQSVKKMTFLTD